MESPIIFGSGLTAALAACIFKDSRIMTDEVKEPHKAVLRFRTNEISKITGIPFKKVTVYKDVYTCQDKIPAMNSYSKKVTGGYYDRSIADLSPVTRWIAPEDFHTQLMLACNMEDRLEITDEIYKIAYEENRPAIISTYPLYTFVPGAPSNATNCNSIYVTKNLIANADLYQTVYFPDPDINVYRMTMEGNILITEAIAPVSQLQIEGLAREVFALEIDCRLETNFEQKIGKMQPLEEDKRKRTICGLTSDYNIYSLGRVACWRPSVLLDDCLKDIYKIRDMIELHPYERAMKWK